MNNWINALRGTGKVFSFTIRQMYQNRSNLFTMILLLLFALFTLPVMTLLNGTSFRESSEPLQIVYYWNDTDLALAFSDSLGGLEAEEETETAGSLWLLEAAQREESSLGLEVPLLALAAEDGGWEVALQAAVEEQLSPQEAFLYFYQEDGEYYVQAYGTGDESTLDELLTEAVEVLRVQHYEQLGVTAEQLQRLQKGMSSQVSSWDDDQEEENGEAGFAESFALQYGYAILVMILVMMSSSYIVRSVIEEKASKLVETLMVSIRPLALILGKVLAVMVYIFSLLGMMVVGVLLSYVVSRQFLAIGSPAELLAQLGISLSGLQLGPELIGIVVISLLLGYATFSLVAGLTGTGCSSMEDMESANSTVVLLVLAGYMIACISSAFDAGMGVVVSLLPIVSVFCAPVQYACGHIGLAVLMVSWVVQAAVVLLLAWLCGRVYQSLLLYRGKRLGFSQILKLARTAAGGQKGNRKGGERA